MSVRMLTQASAPVSVQNEPDLRLLSYQHNHISSLQRLDRLPSLVFLDAYANAVSSAAGVSALTGLRVLMLGCNHLPDLSGMALPRIFCCTLRCLATAAVTVLLVILMLVECAYCLGIAHCAASHAHIHIMTAPRTRL